MTIAERAWKITNKIQDELARLEVVLAELRAVREEDRIEVTLAMAKSREADVDKAYKRGLEAAAKIADKDHECPAFCRVCKIVDHIREAAGEI